MIRKAFREGVIPKNLKGGGKLVANYTEKEKIIPEFEEMFKNYTAKSPLPKKIQWMNFIHIIMRMFNTIRAKMASGNLFAVIQRYYNQNSEFYRNLHKIISITNEEDYMRFINIQRLILKLRTSMNNFTVIYY